MKSVLKKVNTKYNKGITLIALVITIIVLIILSGISLNLVLGQNGIMTKAKEAKKAQKMAEVKERLSLEIASAETDAILRDENLEKKQVEDIISKYGTLKEDGDTIVTKDDNYELSLKEIWYGVLSESGSYSDKVEQVDMLEKELEDLQKKYDQLDNVNKENSGILEELRGQIEDLQKEKDSLQKDLSDKQEQIETLTSQNSDLQEQLKEAQASSSTTGASLPYTATKKCKAVVTLANSYAPSSGSFTLTRTVKKNNTVAGTNSNQVTYSSKDRPAKMGIGTWVLDLDVGDVVTYTMNGEATSYSIIIIY